MLVPYLDNLTCVRENIMNDITDIEREKMKEFDHIRGSYLSKLFELPDRNEPSIVLDDFLFLGSMQHATNRELLERLEIKHILNVCDLYTDEIIRDNFNVIQIPMSDYPETDIKQHFDRTNELLHGFYQKNEHCLVHCAAGVSRSATIVLAYLMKYHHNTLKEAFYFLIEKRPQISPNWVIHKGRPGFLLQLIRYENELIQSREIKLDDGKNEENPIETFNEFENKNK